MKQVVARGSQTLVVTSNGRSQHLLSLEELPEEDREYFEQYLDGEQRTEFRFARTRGDWVDVMDFETTSKGLSAPDPGILATLGWDGVQTTSHWDGIVARLSHDGESVVLGRFVIQGM